MERPQYIPDIRSEFHSCVAEGNTCYMIVDAAGKNTKRVERLYNEDFDIFPLYANTDFESFTHISPLFFEIRSAAHMQYVLSEPHGNTDYTPGIFLASTLERKILIKHLQNLLEVHLPDLNFAAFRYYDASVLHTFIFGVDNKQKISFCAPFSRVAWPYYDYVEEKYIWLSIKNDHESTALEHQRCLSLNEENIKNFEAIRFQEFALKLDNFLRKI